MWRTRCAVSARKIGGHAPLILTRWYPDQLPVPYNLVLMQRPYAMLLEEGGHEALPVECRQRIEDRLRWAKRVCEGSWEPSNITPATLQPSIAPVETYFKPLALSSLVAVCMLFACSWLIRYYHLPLSYWALQVILSPSSTVSNKSMVSCVNVLTYSVDSENWQ